MLLIFYLQLANLRFQLRGSTGKKYQKVYFNMMYDTEKTYFIRNDDVFLVFMHVRIINVTIYFEIVYCTYDLYRISK